MDWRPSLQTAFNEYFGLPPLQPLPPLQWPQQSTPPTPQEAPKEQAISEEETETTVEKQEQEPLQKPLYQATVEDDTETTAESTMHGNSILGNSSTVSTKPRLCTAPACRDPATYPSNSLTSSFGSFFGSFLTSFSASEFGYIRCTEGIEATGEG